MIKNPNHKKMIKLNKSNRINPLMQIKTTLNKKMLILYQIRLSSLAVTKVSPKNNKANVKKIFV